MGGFLLQHLKQASYFDTDAGLALFRKQGFSSPKKFQLGEWCLFIFDKQKVTHINHIIGKDLKIFSCGTLIVHGQTPKQSLQDVYNHYLLYKTLPGDIIGNYFLIIKTKREINVYVDPENIYNTFLANDYNILSSSFLAICEGIPKLTINSIAIDANLCTGCQVGHDTTFKEISRLDYKSSFSKNGITFNSSPLPSQIPIYTSKINSQKGQLEVLDWLFRGLKPTVKEFGLDSGLTGGFDSRLLLTLIKKHYSTLPHQFHSHKRKNPGPEYKIAMELTKATKSNFISNEVIDPLEQSDNVLIKSIEEGMFFYDGQIRAYAFWHEPYNSASYRKIILNDKGIGFHGIGGEQYRNYERFLGKYWNTNDWIKYGIIRKISTSKVLDEKSEDLVISFLKNIIRNKIGINDKLSHLDLKRYLNEIYIPSNRGVRTSMENKLAFFVSPFADHRVSLNAYGAIPFLGLSLNYQAELIKRLDFHIASIKSDYGFDFVKGEKFTSYLPLIVAENILPWPIWLKIISFAKNRNKESRWTKINKEFKILDELKTIVDSFHFGFDSKKLLQSPDLGPLVFSLGYLLKYYKHKIKE